MSAEFEDHVTSVDQLRLISSLSFVRQRHDDLDVQPLDLEMLSQLRPKH